MEYNFSNLNNALKKGDNATFLHILSQLALKFGMTKLSNNIKVNRESLYKSLNGKRNPRFDTIVKILRTLGFQLTITPAKGNENEQKKA